MKKTDIFIYTFIVVATVFAVSYCNSERNKNNNQIKRLLQLKKIDSIRGIEKLTNLFDSISSLKNKIDTQKIIVRHGDSVIGAMQHEINALLTRHKPITKATDTSITVVPNEFIDDCEGCFTALRRQTDDINKNRNERAALDLLYIEQSNVYEGTIKELQAQNDTCNKRFNQLSVLCMQQPEPTRKLKIGPAMLFINNKLPNAFGAGALYEDLRGNSFGARVYSSKVGTIYGFDAYKTISFKRKKK